MSTKTTFEANALYSAAEQRLRQGGVPGQRCSECGTLKSMRRDGPLCGTCNGILCIFDGYGRPGELVTQERTHAEAWRARRALQMTLYEPSPRFADFPRPEDGTGGGP